MKDWAWLYRMVQDNWLWCAVVNDGARWCFIVQNGSGSWYWMVQDCVVLHDNADDAGMCRILPDCAKWCRTVHYFSLLSTILLHPALSGSILCHFAPPEPFCHLAPSCTILHHRKPFCTIWHYRVSSRNTRHHPEPLCIIRHYHSPSFAIWKPSRFTFHLIPLSCSLLISLPSAPLPSPPLLWASMKWDYMKWLFKAM